MTASYITVSVIGYYASWTTGIAQLQPDGAWLCRRLVNPTYLQVEEAMVFSERQATRWLRQNRWCIKFRKVRMPQKRVTNPKTCTNAAST